MVADGVLLTTYAGSSVDFKNGETVVAYIQRDYYNSTIATLHCNTAAFGTMYEYAVTYLGWEEPSMPSVVAIPALPQSVNGAGRTLQLRKGDNSAWTEADVRNLEIKIGNDTCDVVLNGGGYDFTLNGTVYCTITGSSVTGSRITILCHGTSEGQPLTYTITSMEIVEPPVSIVTSVAMPYSISSGSRFDISKSDGSAFTEEEILNLVVVAEGAYISKGACTCVKDGSQYKFSRSSRDVCNISESVVGSTSETMFCSIQGTIYSVELGS